MSRWLGYEQTNLVGKRLLDILTIGGKVYWETHVRPLLRMQGSVEGIALDFVQREGAVVPAFGSVTMVHNADSAAVETRLAIFKAVERRQFEQGLVSARKVEAERIRLADENLRTERQNAELREQFIAVLRHDLRNPLGAFVGGLRLLARENLSERASKLIPMMSGSAARMSELIDNVMDFAKGRLGGGIVLDRNAHAPLGPTLLQVVDELRTSHPDRAIEVELSIDEPVDCDRPRIGQLMSNLLGNALTHGAPELPIRLTAFTTTGALEIAIANGGSQITAAAMEKLFQPFFRGDVRPSQQGLGLGLHIASEIAKAHGGMLTATSSAEETRFVFTMPLLRG